MAARLSAGMLVSALIRRTEAAGGSAMVLARGDATAGVLLIQLAERGVPGALLERVLDPTGTYRWTPTGPADSGDRTDYIARRRQRDPDLWVVELDAADARTIVDEVTE
ncbi:DUF1491 family protein [Sphingomonas nostoxanthinifaciens]|uniref:DUF1491 family protein n=1 Tax=Sphingomonas nostoxanthinifaciens TaxID=2872652 RepID=UPI001CC1E442|nr:DUF1491 family protein [Sphingomonas nostoxanthinifaciens]UAK24643.1 DUF1491 family protein [Sphingomonas nostoxanthinifaciens]